MQPAIVESVSYNGHIAPRHFTDRYELVQKNADSAVFRRGFNFYLTALLDREFNVDSDGLRVDFNFGPATDAIWVRLRLEPGQTLSISPNEWGISLERIDQRYIMAEIHIASNAPVGIWGCTVQTYIRGTKDFKPFKVPNDLYILFNPWSPEDTVYMENEDERNEYILNDIGKIFLGTWWSPQGRYWFFDQFDDVALRTAIFLLDKSKLSRSDRGNPILVSRTLSALINSDDDSGLLVANWDGNFSDGTPPYAWTGSIPILEQYYNSGGVPVRYGQCWVFSAVTVTICRALGIPCRSTTVYITGQGGKDIVRNYDAFGNLIENGKPSKSLWSFHSWNDVWMSRPRMPERFGGWQIIDATPLRRSEGIMRCGPASLEAVRQNYTDYQYDTDFVYDMLNADVSHIVIDDNSELGEYRLPRNNYQAGRKVVTKAIGSDDIWDVTNLYKAPLEITDNGKSDVTFQIVPSKVPFGETLNVTIKITNNTNSSKTIWTVLGGKSVDYTGQLASLIDRRDDNFSIASGDTKTLSQLSIPASKYIPTLVDQGFIKLYAFGEVKETEQRWAEEEDFIFAQPAMSINTGKPYYKVGESIELSFSFKNPANVKLTNCSYMIQGPVDVRRERFKSNDVLPLQEVSVSGKYTVRGRVGPRRIIVNFTSRQLPLITGSNVINIIRE